ncbi:MAG: hypothetical protein ABI674_09075 [Spartobacteria bacterium]
MPQPSAEQIADIILNRRQVYDLDTDSQIRQAADRLTTRALFELLARLDDQSLDFLSPLSALLRAEGPSSFIGFRAPSIAEPDIAGPSEKPIEHYLRLIFRDKEAAYYQFPLFPNLDADYILGASRKRAGAVQHIRVLLSGPDALQTFIESCRDNPHFLRVEQSTAEEFQSALSDRT